MKQISIFLMVTILSVSTHTVNGQTANSESKSIIVKNLVKSDVYLTEASNSAYDNMCRLEFHKKAIESYLTFSNSYDNQKANLSTEINDKLEGIINVYSQLTNEENFKYLSDASTITALLICSANIDKVIELILE